MAARELTLSGDVRVKERSPGVVFGLGLVTAGVYFVWWWYEINRELRDYGRVAGGPDPIRVRPALAAAAAAVGALGALPVVKPSTPFVVIGLAALVPALVTTWRTSRRVRRAQELSGSEAAASPELGVVIYVLLAFVLGFYLQWQLNAVWRSASQHS